VVDVVGNGVGVLEAVDNGLGTAGAAVGEAVDDGVVGVAVTLGVPVVVTLGVPVGAAARPHASASARSVWTLLRASLRLSAVIASLTCSRLYCGSEASSMSARS
jgi:hypothetical protein